MASIQSPELNKPMPERLSVLSETNSGFVSQAKELNTAARKNLPPGVVDTIKKIGVSSLVGVAAVGIDLGEAVMTAGIPDPFSEIASEAVVAEVAKHTIGFEVSKPAYILGTVLNLVPALGEVTGPTFIQAGMNVMGGMMVDLPRAVMNNVRNTFSGGQPMAKAA